MLRVCVWLAQPKRLCRWLGSRELQVVEVMMNCHHINEWNESNGWTPWLLRISLVHVSNRFNSVLFGMQSLTISKNGPQFCGFWQCHSKNFQLHLFSCSFRLCVLIEIGISLDFFRILDELSSAYMRSAQFFTLSHCVFLFVYLRAVEFNFSHFNIIASAFVKIVFRRYNCICD